MMTMTEVNTYHKEQLVEFAHASPGWSNDVVAGNDSSMMYGESVDTSLAAFLERPLKIFQTTWTLNSTLGGSFDPWSLFLEDPNVADKIRRYAFIRSKIHVKVVINGNGFYYGRAFMAYKPTGSVNLDDKGVAANTNYRRMQVSMLPHVSIDATTSKGGCISAPMLYPDNWISLAEGNYSDLARIYLVSISDLHHANNATADNLNVSVYAWMTDVHLAVPTISNLDTIVPQADEYEENGPISTIAGTVAKVSGALTDIPVIAPLAKATEMGAKMVGKVARLFGFSRPIVLDPPKTFTHRPFGNLAVTDMDENVQKLTVESKQELNVDPRTIGLQGKDDMTLRTIFERETFLKTIPWASATAADQLLCSIAVNPLHTETITSGTQFSSLCFGVFPFAFWRGTIKYRFSIIASAHHKGRIRIVWDPYDNAATSQGENIQHSKVIDLAECRDFEIDVGWGSKVPYKTSILPFDTVSAVSQALATNACNGSLSIYVVNPLTVPSGVSADVDIAIFTKAGDDFQVAVPSNKLESVIWDEDIEIQSLVEIEPQAGGDEPGEGNQGGTDLEPGNSDGMQIIGDTVDYTDASTFFGEAITSVRQMIKRYSYSQTFTAARTGLGVPLSQVSLTWPVHVFPPFRGPTGAGGAWHTTGAGNPYNYTGNTHVNYFSMGYIGWRGSIRSKFRAHVDGEDAPKSVLRVTRSDDSLSVALCLAGAGFTQAGLDDDSVNHWKVTNKSGCTGTAITSVTLNNILEVEHPYYHPKRFAHTRIIPNVVAYTPRNITGNHDICYLNLEGDIKNTDFVERYVAAGDDFSFFGYIGPPVMYLNGGFTPVP
eukprot:NODE_9_length_4797_cov_77.447767_g8_i0.p1 GENE.NODE_9_length_4797_cov_77.447767_g8_i0~~NODE_9_length_4797_cov_77.447767_g8_i0.p1  ORF type:complete len:828 (+),score=1.44 NODE_9_length_4797_cov_77.447767_g8_i0:2067-4550(+)